MQTAASPLVRAAARAVVTGSAGSRRIGQRALATAGGGTARPPSHAAMAEVTPEVRRRNRLVGLACLAFAGSVYAYSIRKLKEEDLSELEDVTVVNLHESGLKATKFKGLLEQSKAGSGGEEDEEEAERQREKGADPSVAMVAADGADAAGGGGKNGGWRKYVLFWKKE